MDTEYPEIDTSATHKMCNQMSSSLELFLGDNQMKLFGVHTIIDGEQFTEHKGETRRYTKYFSIHMLDKKPDESLVSSLTKTFFQEETLNDVRVVGNNIYLSEQWKIGRREGERGCSTQVGCQATRLPSTARGGSGLSSGRRLV